MLKKRLITALKILIALVVSGWVGWELYKLYKSWGAIQEHFAASPPDYLLLTLSGLCYAVAFIPAAIYWRYVMRTLGQQPGWFETFRAYYIGHLGKYVPGKAMVMILRTGLLNRERTKIPAAAASIFVETMTMMAVGAFIAALMMLPLTMLPWFRDFEYINWLTYLALGIMFCTLLPILPPVFHFVTRKLKKYNIELEGLRFRTLAAGWLLNIPVWIVLGFSLWLTMLGLGVKSESMLTELLFCTLAISISIVFGFASMLPGGFGAREFALRHLFILFFTVHQVADIGAPAMAVVIVIVYRIISILAELAVSAVLVGIRYKR